MEVNNANVAHQVTKTNIAQKTSNNLQYNFKGDVKNDTFELKAKNISNKDLKAKKVVTGFASFILPGAGQAVNGEWNKGLKMFGVTMAGCLAGTFACAAGAPIFLLVLLYQLGMGIYSAVDAVKNTKI